MKKLLLFLCISFSVLSFSQTIQSDIEGQFRDFNALIAEKNFDKALDLYANEDFLKIFPKDQMVQLMDQMFNMEGIDFKIYKPEDIAVSKDVVKEGDKSYIKINYRQSLDIKLNMPNVTNDQFYAALQEEFGADHVKFNDSTKFFEVRMGKEAIASSHNLKNWKFTVIEKKQIPILRQFIPIQFLKELK